MALKKEKQGAMGEISCFNQRSFLFLFMNTEGEIHWWKGMVWYGADAEADSGAGSGGSGFISCRFFSVCLSIF